MARLARVVADGFPHHVTLAPPSHHATTHSVFKRGMVSGLDAMKLNKRPRIGLLLEAATATAPTILLLVLSLFYFAPLMIYATFFPFPGDHTAASIGYAYLVVYLGDFLSVIVFWKNIIKICHFQNIRMNIVIVVAMIFGAIGSLHIFEDMNIETGLLVSIPPWFVVIHAMYLNWKLES